MKICLGQICRNYMKYFTYKLSVWKYLKTHWQNLLIICQIHRSARGVCPRTPREIRLYQDEREIRAHSGTGGGRGLLKNEEKRKRSRKERIQAGGGKSGRVTVSFLLLLLLPTCGRAFLFFPPFLTRVKLAETSLLDACCGACIPCATRKYGVQRGSRKQNWRAMSNKVYTSEWIICDFSTLSPLKILFNKMVWYMFEYIVWYSYIQYVDTHLL